MELPQAGFLMVLLTFLNYPVKHLAGKSVEYTLKVDNIKVKKIPELSDEFAQGLGSFETVDDLRKQIRKDMEKHKEEHAAEDLREKLLRWLEDHNEFEVPDSLVQRQLQVRLQRLWRDVSRQGFDPQHLDVDWTKVRDDQQNQAVRDVKGSLILEHIGDRENVAVTDEEIDQEIERIAAETNRPKEKVHEVLNRDSGMSRLKTQLRNKKILDILQSRASIQAATAASSD